MFRLETRCVIITLLFLSWTVLTVLLVKYSTERSAFQKLDTNLKEELKILRTKLDSLEQRVSLDNIGNGSLSDDRYITLERRHILLTENKKKQNKRGENKDNLKYILDTDYSNNQSRDVNIFVETVPTKSELFPPKQIQFFKTFGSSGNHELFKYVKKLPEDKRKRILVTGGAGFVGSHLVDSLMLDGHEVIVCDNFYTGRKSNIDHWRGHSNFELLNHDVIDPLTIEVNEIYHLASPASPVHYMSNPIKTIKTNTLGTINMLGLAKRVGAKILIASTSEIYGDPEVHPQSESYWGHTNSVGPRSCYDESKRLSESLAIAYYSRENVSIRIARIFNTYGPRMHPNDGRVVSNFLIQAISNQPMTVYGSGQQTRSFQYVTDLVTGLKKLMDSNVTSPVNLGNPNEMTIYSLALQIKQIAPNSTSNIVFNVLPTDDPHRRKPNIEKAINFLNWKPVVPLLSGLQRTTEYFSQELSV